MSTSVTADMHGEAYLVRVDDGGVNALDLAMIDEMLTAIAAAPADAALVIAGRPGYLTAGLDRSVMLGPDRAAVSCSLRRVTDLLEMVLRHPGPTVVACTGHALAAGALLLLVADHRIGARVTSKIGFNESRIGLPLGPLAVAAARARLDPRALVQATVQGVVYDAVDALAVGYLDALAEADSVVDASVAHAVSLSKLNRKAYLRTRELLWAPVRTEVSEALARRAGKTAATATS